MRGYTQYRIVEVESVDELNTILKTMQLDRLQIHDVRRLNSMNGFTEYEILFQLLLDSEVSTSAEANNASNS